MIYAAGYGHRRLVYNIVATYFREQTTYLRTAFAEDKYGGVKLKTERNHEEEPEKGDMQHSANLLKASKKEEDEDSGTFIGYFPQGYSRKNKDENYANIRLKFVSDEPPEGLMRIQEQYTKITL